MDEDLTQGPIPKLILRLAIPASIGFFFHTMYNAVDQVFAGKFISEDALAALALSFPVFFILIAINHGVYAGGVALVSNALGEGDRDRAALLTAQTITFSIFATVIIMLLGWTCSPFLFRLLKAEPEVMDLALRYMRIIFGGTLFFLFTSVFNVPMMARGNTRVFRNSLILGFVLNVLFDPWFIFGGFGVPAMGFDGIAIATVLIQVINAVYIGHASWRAGYIRRETLGHLVPNATCQRELLRYSGPAALNMATVAIGIFVITFYAARFGMTEVAAYGVATRIEQIVLLPSIGLNIATLSIVGQNFGAKRFDRVQETVHIAFRYGLYLMVAGGLLMFLGAEWLMGLFMSKDRVANYDEVVAIGTHYLHIAAPVLFAYVILFVSNNALQGMKRPMYAIWIGLYRQLFAPVLIIYLLTQVFHMGVSGVWWGVFIVTWSAAVFTWWYMRRVLNTYMVAAQTDSGPSAPVI
ncbi:MAG: putative MATE family efflux protein [Kiritimatiellia bacterium]|jgi:putative MATE family efflux protein